MPAERTREHTAPLAAARRRRLRADRARQLADLLRHLVLTGGFPSGALPHEDVLAADYQVSRNTVRHALDLLAPNSSSNGCPASAPSSSPRSTHTASTGS